MTKTAQVSHKHSVGRRVAVIVLAVLATGTAAQRARATTTGSGAPASTLAAAAPAPPMVSGRTGHAETALPDGTVLITGGWGARGAIGPATAVAIFDPVTATLTAVAPLHTARAGHTATLLQDGTVLVTGGETRDGRGSLAFPSTATAEVYNPAADTWTDVASIVELCLEMANRIGPHDYVLLCIHPRLMQDAQR